MLREYIENFMNLGLAGKIQTASYQDKNLLWRTTAVPESGVIHAGSRAELIIGLQRLEQRLWHQTPMRSSCLPLTENFVNSYLVWL